MLKVNPIEERSAPVDANAQLKAPKKKRKFLDHQFISRHFKKNQSLVKKHQEKKLMRQQEDLASTTNLTQVVQSAANRFQDIGHQQLKTIVEKLDYQVERIYKDTKHESVCLVYRKGEQKILKLIKSRQLDSVTKVYRRKLENEHQILNLVNFDPLYPAVQAYTQFPYPHFLMEFVQGDSLQQLLDVSLFSLKERLFIAKQILQAVFGIQRKGIVHNELSFENFVINSSLELKLVGFHDSEILDISNSRDGIKASKLAAECFQVGTMLYTLLSGKALCAPKDIVFSSQLSAKQYLPTLEFTPEGEKIPAHIAEMIVKLISPKQDERCTSLAMCIDQW